SAGLRRSWKLLGPFTSPPADRRTGSGEVSETSPGGQEFCGKKLVAGVLGRPVLDDVVLVAVCFGDLSRMAAELLGGPSNQGGVDVVERHFALGSLIIGLRSDGDRLRRC